VNLHTLAQKRHSRACRLKSLDVPGHLQANTATRYVGGLTLNGLNLFGFLIENPHFIEQF
jgi:hypothetical protein